MPALLLLFALQFQTNTVRAIASDSVVARSLLMSGLAAVETPSFDLARSTMSVRYLEQLRLWGMVEEGGIAAFRLDSAVMRAYRTGSTHNTYYWLSTLLNAGDTLAVDRFIARTPEVTRDEVLALVVKDQMHARPQYAARLEVLMTKPWPRAEVLHHRAMFVLSRTDSAAARAMLAEAISLAVTDTVFGTHIAWRWMIELMKRGGPTSVEEILQAALLADSDLWNARADVADALMDNGFQHLTIELRDSLEAGIERQEIGRRPHSRIRLLYLRRTRSDSATAIALNDSIALAWNRDPDVLRQRETHRQLGDLYETMYKVNASALREALARPVSDTVLAEFLRYARTVTTLPGAVSRDSVRSYANAVIALTEPLIRSRRAEFRDSVQVYRVGILAHLNPTEGLRVAGSIPTRRFRDRAASEAIVRLVSVDAETAEREANLLQDSTARATAYGALAQVAVAGGRLPAAAEFAMRTTGESRVRALFTVATAQYRGGLHDHARRTILRAFDGIDAEPRCDGCIVVTTAAPLPRSRGTEPGLLAAVVLLMQQLGMQEQLVTWASRQADDVRRSNASLEVVEAMSQHLLGWRPRLRIH